MAGPMYGPLAHPPLKPHVVGKPATLEYGTGKPPLQRKGGSSDGQEHHQHEWIGVESPFTDGIPYVCKHCLQFMSNQKYSEICSIVLLRMEEPEGTLNEDSPMANVG